MKIKLHVIVATFILVLSFLGGLEVSKQVWANAAAITAKRSQLLDLHGCFFTMDSSALRIVRHPNENNTREFFWRSTHCMQLLDVLDKNEQNEEVGKILGEIKLFLNGYSTTMSEITIRQERLRVLYTNFFVGNIERMREAQLLEIRQVEQIAESYKFLNHLEKLVLRAW